MVLVNTIGVLPSAAPPLGTLATFAVVASSTVTSTGLTVINGDLGLSPGSSVTGSPPGVLNATEYTGAAGPAGTNQDDLTTAYNAAVSTPCDVDLTGQDLGGQTLTPGTYCFNTSGFLTGILTLSGDGVYIFKAGSTIITAPNSSVVLINGAQACNVFWAVGSSATIDISTVFVGTVM